MKSLYKARRVTTAKAYDLRVIGTHFRADRMNRTESIKVVRHLIAQGVKLDRMKKRETV
jgi:hypothetical protein